MGTSTAVRVVLESEPATVPDGLWCYRVDRQLPLMGGALSEGGNILNWLGQILQLPANAEALAAAIPPDSHGLTFLPLLAGERSPGWAGEARGILTGISLGTTPLAILRAALEGVACRVALVYQLLSAALPLGGSDKSHLVGSGGTLQHSPAMAQIIADVIGMPLTISIAPEASARGAAMLALLAIHAMPDLSAYPFYAGTVLEPDSGRHALYQAAIERQKALYVATIRST
jgi:gluconokinase